MKKLLCIIAALTAAVMMASCSGGNGSENGPAPAPAPENEAEEQEQGEETDVLDGGIEGIAPENCPRIDGSTANHPLLAAICAKIRGITPEEADEEYEFDLGSTGSIWINFMSQAREYTPDLLIVYEPPEDVKEEYKAGFSELEIDPLGRDGLVFMVNAGNPVESLTVQQLYDIYTGKITNWKEVGGNDEAIKPFQRNEDSGSQTLFMKLLMKGETPMDPPTELKKETMGGLIDAVAEYDGEGSSIGFSVYYYANLMHANPSLKLIKVDGVEPSNKSIEEGSYPLANDFYTVINADEPADSEARILRDWLLTEEGRALLESQNYVWARNGMEPVSAGTDNVFTK